MAPTKAACKLLALALSMFWMAGVFPAQAQVQQASQTLVPKFLNQTLNPLPTDKEAYLVVTAGGASTDLLVIANPSVPPAKLVQALQSAVAATPLQSQPIQWSSPTPRTQWTAVHTSRRQGRLGVWQASNTVPIGAFCDGLHRAGFQPHPAMHIPDVAFCAPLPAPFADFGGYGWYDLEQMHSRDFLQVRDTVAPTDLIFLLLPFFVIPGIGLAGQALASRWANGKDRTRQNRKRFELMSSLPATLCLVGWLVSQMFSGGSLPQWQTVGDVWFGQAGNSGGVSPSIIWFVLILMASSFALLNGQRASMRLFGPEGAVPVTAMSSQERSLREREALWSAALPLLLCGIALVLLIGGRSWLPAGIPPAAFRLLPALLLLPLSLYFQKKRKAFTTLVPDPALTDRVRQLAAAPGQAPPEVAVEDSGRARTYAFLENASGGRIVVSQRLCEVATPDQMNFLLVSQSVIGRTRDWSKALSLVILAALFLVLLSAKPLASLGHLTSLIVMLSLLLILVVAMFVSIAVTTRQNAQRLLEADQTALRLTNNPNAALEALEILRQNAMPASSSSARQSQVSVQLAKRIAALNSELTRR